MKIVEIYTKIKDIDESPNIAYRRYLSNELAVIANKFLFEEIINKDRFKDLFKRIDNLKANPDTGDENHMDALRLLSEFRMLLEMELGID